MAQGLVHRVVPFFGGKPAKGTAGRTAAHVRDGTSSPAAMHVPLAVLAGVLLHRPGRLA